MMRLSFGLLLLAGSVAANADTLFYTDFSEWVAATAGNPLVAIAFDSYGTAIPPVQITPRAYPNVPGNGHAEGNAWVDCVGLHGACGKDYDATEIRLTNGGQMKGLWGYWDTSESGTGLSMILSSYAGIPETIAIVGEAPPVPWGDYGAYHGWMGFISDNSFDDVNIWAGGAFTLSNGLIDDPSADATATPEPASLTLFGLLLMCVAGIGRSRHVKRILSAVRSV